MDNKYACLELYREAFDDRDIPFEEALFDICFKYCRYVKENDRITSMLFTLPCELITNNESIKCSYIYAAATLKEFRGRGYMGGLINELKKESLPLILRPASDRLINFYKRLGFEAVSAHKGSDKPYLKPIEDFEILTERFPEQATGEEYTAMYYSNERLKIKNINFIYTME